jgi:hypothetical protein
MSSFEENQSISYLGTQNALKSLPVVEQTQEYLAIFKGVGSSSPEVIDNSSFFITYLVDSQGNPIKVSSDSVALQNIIQNFSDQNRVIVRVDQATSLNKQLEGEHSITSIGSIVPLIYTQIGDDPQDYTNYITFKNPNDSTVDGTANYLASMRKTTTQEINLSSGNSIILTQFNSLISTASSTAAIFNTGSASGSLATGSYELANSFPSPDLITSITIQASTLLESSATLGLDAGESAQFSLELYRKRGGVETLLKRQVGTIARVSSTGGGR